MVSNLIGIQLNCRSLNNKLGDVKLLVYVQKPDYVLFSETWIASNKGNFPKFYNYSSEWKCRPHRTGGGLGILVRRGLQYQTVDLQPFNGGVLEVMAIKIFSSDDRTISILNIYNPNKDVSISELNHYINQLGTTYLIAGDLNAHTPILDDRDLTSNYTGRTLEDLISDGRTCLINPINFYTYINVANYRRSCLDICLSSENIAPLTSLTLMRDVGSDHMPILIETCINPVSARQVFRKKWKSDSSTLSAFGKSVKESQIINPASTESLAEDFINRVVESASRNLKQTSGKPRLGKCAPWWDSECYRVIYERRKARRNLERFPNDQNAEIFMEKFKIATDTLAKKKDDSFNKFISEISYDTPPKIVWKKMKSLKGYSYSDVGPLSHNGLLTINTENKANLLINHYASVASPRIQGNEEISNIIDEAIKDKSHEYNSPISWDELNFSLSSTNDSSPGDDEITYSLLKNLSQSSLSNLLNIYNQMFSLGNFPTQFKRGLIIPIYKPGKPKDQVSSFRPITMLSCVGKVFEKIIKNRLEYVIEENKILNVQQCGFRRGQSTIDVLLRLEYLIRSSLCDNKVCLVTYIDLKSAFDTIWGDGVLYKIAGRGIRGNLLGILRDYMRNRSAKVWLNGETSSSKSMEGGSPQGAILSPTLFNLMLSDVPQQDEVTVLIYADDITIVSSHREYKQVKRNMQRYLNSFQEWVEEWGLEVNLNKTYFQYFTKKRMATPIIRMNNRVLKYNKVQKILGLNFDSPRLTFKNHIDTLKADCLRRINIMKALSSNTLGASSRVLRQFYIAYIRSKIDYGSIIYGSASESSLRKLDVIQNSCLRMILGARKTSPILSLEAESNIPPLSLHRGNLLVKMYLKLKFKQTKSHTSSILELHSLDARPPQNSFLERARHWISELSLPLSAHVRIQEPIFSSPPWRSIRKYVIPHFQEEVVDNQSFLHYFHQNWPTFKSIFTDGSKIGPSDNPSVACGLYVPSTNSVTCWKLNPFHSVLASELYAVWRALSSLSGIGLNIIIFTDSKSALQLITSRIPSSYEVLISKIQYMVWNLNQNNRVILHWVKGHCNITGNELADRAANLGHSNNRSELFPLGREEYTSLLKCKFKTYWNNYWQQNVSLTGKGTFLKNIRESLSAPNIIDFPLKRREHVVLSRLRIGHAATKMYLYRFRIGQSDEEEQGECEFCALPDTIEHYLLHCNRFQTARARLKSQIRLIGIHDFNIKTLLGGDPNHYRSVFQILSASLQFIRETNLLNSL